MSNDVTVYHDGTVILDGVKLKHVASVTAPVIHGGLQEPGKVVIDVLGSMLFTGAKYVEPPRARDLTPEYYELKQRVRQHIQDGTERLILDGLP